MHRRARTRLQPSITDFGKWMSYCTDQFECELTDIDGQSNASWSVPPGQLLKSQTRAPLGYRTSEH